MTLRTLRLATELDTESGVQRSSMNERRVMPRNKVFACLRLNKNTKNVEIERHIHWTFQWHAE